MAKLRWTREAEQWLKDIYEYIARDKAEGFIDILGVFHSALDIEKYFP